MHYYAHNMKSFNSATRHLSRLARHFYRDMIELYYEDEGPLPKDLDLVCRRIRAKTKSEITLVEQVLKEFFVLTEEGWENADCEERLRDFLEVKKSRSKAGKVSQQVQAEKRKGIKVVTEDVDEHVLNKSGTELELTNNHKPIPNNNSARFARPTLEEVRNYCEERNNGINAEEFVNFYESKGWKIGKAPMKNWKSAVTTWELRRKAEAPKTEEVWFT